MVAFRGTRSATKYNAATRRGVQGGAGGCRGVQGNAGGCRGVQGDSGGCRGVQGHARLRETLGRIDLTTLHPSLRHDEDVVHAHTDRNVDRWVRVDREPCASDDGSEAPEAEREREADYQHAGRRKQCISRHYEHRHEHESRGHDGTHLW